MRRVRLVLAVVAAMVTVLVFAAPAFALPSPTAEPEGGSAGQNFNHDIHLNLQPNEGYSPGGAGDLHGENTIGGRVAEQALTTTGHGTPIGHHVMHVTGQTPGENIQCLQGRC